MLIFMAMRMRSNNAPRAGCAPARIMLLRCLGRASRRFVQFFNASALPPEHGDARQRDEEGEEEKSRPAEALSQGAGGGADVDAAERGERGEQRVLRRREAPVAHRHEQRFSATQYALLS